MDQLDHWMYQNHANAKTVLTALVLGGFRTFLAVNIVDFMTIGVKIPLL